MKVNNHISSGTIFILLAFLLIVSVSCRNRRQTKELPKEKRAHVAAMNVNDISVPPLPFSDGIFPCTDCHAHQTPSPIKRVLNWHEDIDTIFSHDKENRWCLDCHSLASRDSLKLASGKLIPFRESFKLCGQCHGDKYRDWKVGVHGKRTGEWNGKREYLLCVHCHNPHSPKFKSLKPEAPPHLLGDIEKDQEIQTQKPRQDARQK